MDWYSWLSKTNLEPTLVYEYGLTFARNELQEEDLNYFNHEFLQSIGINIAKHRLEIIKLARKDERGRPNGFSRILLAMNKTKRLFTRNIVKWGFQKNPPPYPVSEPSPCRTQWTGRALRKINSEKGYGQEKATCTRTIMKSGPLDRKVQEKLMATGRSLSVSGPLNGKIHERLSNPNWSPMVTRPTTDGSAKDRMGFMCRSPALSGPIDRWSLSPKVSPYNQYNYNEKVGDGDQSLWYLMFQDMKPT